MITARFTNAEIPHQCVVMSRVAGGIRCCFQRQGSFTQREAVIPETSLAPLLEYVDAAPIQEQRHVIAGTDQTVYVHTSAATGPEKGFCRAHTITMEGVMSVALNDADRRRLILLLEEAVADLKHGKKNNTTSFGL